MHRVPRSLFAHPSDREAIRPTPGLSERDSIVASLIRSPDSNGIIDCCQFCDSACPRCLLVEPLRRRVEMAVN